MSVDEFKAKGNEAFKAQRYQEAIGFYSKAIEVDGNSVAAGALYSNRAASYTSLQQFDLALEDADACIRVRPDWLKGYFRKGVALQATQRLDESVKAFGGALAVDPKNEEVSAKLAELNNAIKARNESRTPAKCSTADEAKMIGNSLFGQGKYEVSMGYYARAIELFETMVSKEAEESEGWKKARKEMANCYANRAACHQQTHTYRQVIIDCNEALYIDEFHVKALLRRAIAQEGLEKWQKALDDYNLLKRLSPGLSNVSAGAQRCMKALRG